MKAHTEHYRWIQRLGLCLVAFCTLASWRVGLTWAGEVAEESVWPSAPERCLNFDDDVALEARRAEWYRAIVRASSVDRNAVLAWVTGQKRPPAEIENETRQQLDCLVSRLFSDAADPEHPLLLDLGHRSAKTPRDRAKREMTRYANRFEKSARWRRILTKQLTRSDYRSARHQSVIWYRKFLFRHRPFNRVSRRAAEKCDLVEGGLWQTHLRRYAQCWKQTLAPGEREREILVASSAPGISRHHWGTELDLFGLNPLSFQPEAHLHDEYLWMVDNARVHGFFQPFSEHANRPITALDHRPRPVLGYMEERWHWSYYPIAEAISDYLRDNQSEFERVLHAQWDELEKRWNHRRRTRIQFFGFVREHWRDYVFNIATIEPDGSREHPEHALRAR